MIDDWKQRVTQLGLTKTTHEYAVYQLLATAIGWRVWRKFLPAKFADHLTRAVLQPDIPVRRMANERKTKLTDALVHVLRRLLTPATVTLPGLHDLYLRNNLLALAGHEDGHILTRRSFLHQLTMRPNLQHAIERVGRPGESHGALDGKKRHHGC